jgi:3-keto-5-aminohexanoate cleavage enzyme
VTRPTVTPLHDPGVRWPSWKRQSSIEQVLSGAGIALPRLLHGTGVTAWPLLVEAARRGCQVRIGLEDTLLMPGGELAPDNAALVAAARRVLEDASRTLGAKRGA